MLPDDLPYDGWIDYVFDHPVLDPQWWWQDEETGHYQVWNENAHPSRTLAYLTQLFRDPVGLIGRFSRAQIDQGLHLLISNSCSTHMYVLTNTDLPWTSRQACFDAMFLLYQDLMAPVYGDYLGHRKRIGDASPSTYSCYMWWDIIPLYGGMDHPDMKAINDTVFRLFEQILSLRAESCLESALHGLGHWHLYEQERASQIVNRFLVKRKDISPALRNYAQSAAIGSVN